jgi:hypothetical protein
MSSYVKATNFATKDTLPTGDSNKIVKGTEIDNEFNSIAGAISSKADIASPTFTGTPAAPTATAGSNTTQLATTAYVKTELTTLQTAIQALYPVGSIYINAAVSTNPATLLGFGTWVEFGSGRVMVGLNASDSDFDTVEETGGAKTATTSSSGEGSTSTNTVVVSRDGWGTGGSMPSPSSGITAGRLVVGSGAGESVESLESLRDAGNNLTTGSHSHTISNHTHTVSTVSPYIVVRMWKRTV